MNAFVSWFFLNIFTLLGVGHYPQQASHDWKIMKEWNTQGNAHAYTTTLSSASISRICQDKKESYLVFPELIHSYQEVIADGKLVGSFGNKDFSVATPFYEKSYISCRVLAESKEIVWQATTYSQFFARLKSYPVISENPFAANFLSLTANILAFGSLLVLSVFCFYLFKGKVSNQLAYSIAASSFLLSIYFLNTVNIFFNLSFSMLAVHKVADTALWLGGGLITASYFYDHLLKKLFLAFFWSSIVAGLGFIIFGGNADIVQFGTTLPMLGWLMCNLNILSNLFKKVKSEGLSQYIWLKGGSVTAFVIAGSNDVFSIFGVSNTGLFLPVGMVIGVFGVAISVNQSIEQTYKERDGLLENLEAKVLEKTAHLESTLKELRSTQAELVQSAKLASLGTVSAGIAHEINNSINYVSGAIVPLERKVNAILTPDMDRKTIDKLFAAIKEGTTLTVEIVKSLRNFTGLNHAEFKDVNVSESLRSIQIILKSKMKGVEFNSNIPDTFVVRGNMVGLNQVFMNLISNSLDAFDKEEKVLSIHGTCENGQAIIRVKDNGSGIDPQIQQKIFDPFFTTKDVGKGTGLGLHIVAKEVEKHGGKIQVQSSLGSGTEFIISLPASSNQIKEAA